MYILVSLLFCTYVQYLPSFFFFLIFSLYLFSCFFYVCASLSSYGPRHCWLLWLRPKLRARYSHFRILVMVTLQWRTQFFLSRCYSAFVSRQEHFCRHQYHHHEFALLFHHFFFLSIVLCTCFLLFWLERITLKLLARYSYSYHGHASVADTIFFLTVLFGIRQSSPAFLSSSISSPRVRSTVSLLFLPFYLFSVHVFLLFWLERITLKLLARYSYSYHGHASVADTIFFLTVLFGIRQSSPAFLSSSISSSRIPVHNSIGCKNFLLVYDQFQRYSLHQKEQCISKSLTPVCAFRWFELQFQSISNISTLMIWSTKCFVQPVYKNNIVRQNRSFLDEHCKSTSCIFSTSS